MALGSALHASADVYLLLGVPITAAFQLWVRRGPLHTLWVRNADRFQLDRRTLLVAAAIAVAPVVSLSRYLAGVSRPDWVRIMWLLAAIGGAVGAGFAFRHFTRATMRSLLACAATAGVIGIVLVVAARSVSPVTPPLTAGRALTGLTWFLLYLPVSFVLEEVFFRGALDAHVHDVGESRGVMSAMFVSALWGLWHLPATPLRASLPVTVAGLVVTQVLIGVPLSIYWRRSGNLAVPGTVHAFINGVRNALLVVPI
jgi:membrane protease YdiL (CAAX protease family)